MSDVVITLPGTTRPAFYEAYSCSEIAGILLRFLVSTVVAVSSVQTIFVGICLAIDNEERDIENHFYVTQSMFLLYVVVVWLLRLGATVAFGGCLLDKPWAESLMWFWIPATLETCITGATLMINSSFAATDVLEQTPWSVQHTLFLISNAAWYLLVMVQGLCFCCCK